MTRSACWISLAVLTFWTVSVYGGDWPQYLGPERNATSAETGLAREWPDDGPKVLWSVPLGHGYGGPAVLNGKVYILDRIEGSQDTLRCLNLTTGEEEWNFAYDAPGRTSHPGSRSVPAVDEDRVYTCGPRGDLYCFDKTSHKPLWNKHLARDFGEAQSPRWGFSQNPLLYKDMLIIAPMTSEVGVAALDKVSGEVRWTSPPLPGRPSYASPAIVTVGGVEQIVAIGASSRERSGGRRRDRGRSGASNRPSNGDRDGDAQAASEPGAIVGYDPMTGKPLWSYSGWQCRIPVANLVSLGDGRFFITGGYEAGSAMFRVEKQGQNYTVKEQYKTQDFGTHVHPPLLHQGHLYGHCSTNETRDGLVCMSVEGNLQWKTERSPAFNKGGLILADGMIISVDGADGYLYLIEPSPEGFKPLAKAKLLEKGEVWAPLTLADGKLLIRDQTQMKCVLVR